MTGCEDTDFTALDAHIRTQLARAVESYAAHTDMDARLRTVLEAGAENDRNNTAAADS
jgi:hypothetical protein